MHARAAICQLSRRLKRLLPPRHGATVTPLLFRPVQARRIHARPELRAMEVTAAPHVDDQPPLGALLAAAVLSASTLLAASFSGQEAQCEPYMRSSPRTFDHEYETKSLLGCGTFGVVMQCVRKRDGHVAAVKVIQDFPECQEEVAREKEALALIECAGGHEHIVRFDGAYQHDGFHYIVTELVPGESLYSFVQKRGPLDIPTALSLTTQLASALAFMSSSARGLIHRDLKPENILVVEQDGKLALKIIDFGSAELTASSSPSSSSSASASPQKPSMTLSGTRCYWPPEVLRQQETSAAMDMWALGCILFIMISGRHPFDMMGCSTENEIVERILTSESVSFVHPMWRDVPEDIKSLLRELLDKDPVTRLRVDGLLSHPALAQAHDAA
ncbi:hypothetical protein PINS_up007849 [Pythium insidiosum]|nr:hypothetical protein PINS_up007849 [Pythium insidiosum]